MFAQVHNVLELWQRSCIRVFTMEYRDVHIVWKCICCFMHHQCSWSWDSLAQWGWVRRCLATMNLDLLGCIKIIDCTLIKIWKAWYNSNHVKRFNDCKKMCCLNTTIVVSHEGLYLLELRVSGVLSRCYKLLLFWYLLMLARAFHSCSRLLWVFAWESRIPWRECVHYVEVWQCGQTAGYGSRSIGFLQQDACQPSCASWMGHWWLEVEILKTHEAVWCQQAQVQSFVVSHNNFNKLHT